jgi:hypothetical protein
VRNRFPSVPNHFPGVQNHFPRAQNHFPGVRNRFPVVPNRFPGVQNHLARVPNRFAGARNEFVGCKNHSGAGFHFRVVLKTSVSRPPHKNHLEQQLSTRGIIRFEFVKLRCAKFAFVSPTGFVNWAR